MSRGSGKSVRWQSSLMNAGFTMYPNLVLLREDLTPIAKTLYGLLCHYAREDEKAYPGQELLHTKVPCSPRGLLYALRSLEAATLVETIRMGRGRNNRYVLLDPKVTPHAVKAAQTPPSRNATSADQDTQPVPIKRRTECGSNVTETQKKKTQEEQPPKEAPSSDLDAGGGGEVLLFNPDTVGLSPKARGRLERTRRRLSPPTDDGGTP